MITHKVVQTVVLRMVPQPIVNERGAWENFDSANKQAIDLAERMKASGHVEVHELVPGTSATKKTVVRYVVEVTDEGGGKLFTVRTHKQRIEIPPP